MNCHLSEFEKKGDWKSWNFNKVKFSSFNFGLEGAKESQPYIKNEDELDIYSDEEETYNQCQKAKLNVVQEDKKRK
jgi:hypothetical protein